VIVEALHSAIENFPFLRSMGKASRWTVARSAAARQVADSLVKRPQFLSGSGIERVLEARPRPLPSAVRSRRPMCAFEVRARHWKGIERTLSLIAKWPSGQSWSRSVQANRHLQDEFGDRLEEYGIVSIFGAVYPFRCLLYRRIEGDDLKTMWRRAMTAGGLWRRSVEQGLSLAAQWLRRFQNHRVLGLQLETADGERAACLDILKNGGGALLPAELDAGKLVRFISFPSCEPRVLSHGTFMLQNLIVQNEKLYVLDWEHLHLGHRCEDVSAMFMSILNQGRLFPHRLSLLAASIRHFLGEYLTAEPDVDLRQLMASLMCRLVQQLSWGKSTRFRPDWWWYMPWLRRQLIRVYQLSLKERATVTELLQAIS